MEPEDRGRYLRAVEAHFVAARGRGFMLSARDLQRVEAWRQRAVPLELVLRVLNDGFARFRDHHPGEAAPRSLAWFEPQVDEAFARHLARRERAAAPEAASGEARAEDEASAVETLLAVIAEAGQATDGAAREALRGAWREVRAGASGDLWGVAQSVDDRLVEALLACLPPGDRGAVEAEADLAVEDAGGAQMSDVARREHHAFALARAVRARYGLASLVEVLVEHSL